LKTESGVGEGGEASKIGGKRKETSLRKKGGRTSREFRTTRKKYLNPDALFQKGGKRRHAKISLK